MKPPTPNLRRVRGLRFAIRPGWLGAALSMLAIEAILVGMLLLEAFLFSWFGSPDPARDAILATEVVRLSIAADGEHGLAIVRFERGDVARPAERVLMRYRAAGPAIGEPVLTPGRAPLEIAHSPVADLAVVGCADGSLHLCSSAATRLASPAGLPSQPAHLKQILFSRDGRRVFTLDDVAIQRWRLVDGGLVREGRISARWVCCMAVTANANGIVVGRTGGEIEHWTFDGAFDSRRRAARRLGQCQGPTLAMACAADGTEVVAVDIDGSVHCWNLRDGQKRWKQRPLEYPLAASVVYAGDGARVIVGYQTADAPASYQLFTWDAATGAARSRLEGHTAAISALATNGGSSLLAGDLAGSLRRWELRSCEPTWELSVPAIDLLAQQQAMAEPSPIHVNQRHGHGRRSRQ